MNSSPIRPPQTWRPTTLGKLCTFTKDWSLIIRGDEFMLSGQGEHHSGSVEALATLEAKPGIVWATIRVPLDGTTRTLSGVSNAAAERLVRVLTETIKELRHRRQVAEHVREFDARVEEVFTWALDTRTACLKQLRARGWLTHEFTVERVETRPKGIATLLAIPEVAAHVQTKPAEVQAAVTLCARDFGQFASEVNKRQSDRELDEQRDFFATVEKSPLTEEQARAVICMDNRVLLVASAGSGKTSTMVAKAGYVLKKGYVDPERMLLLAFNNDAAKELRERISARLTPIGLPAEKVVAKTFHAFGLEVVGAATGKKPTVAPWLEGRDLEVLLDLVDEIKDRDPLFRAEWDIYRVVFAHDLPQFGKERESPESWDSANRRSGFWTLNNEVVKSRGEQMLANWLFYNGVRYEYEAPFKEDTADATHRQYRPDFFLPDCGAYLEHWALNERGEPPPDFAQYKESMAWKKATHARLGSILLETTVADLWSGKAFRYLSEELPKLGITLDPNPNREVKGRQPIENPRLARTFRSFLTHVKSNRLTMADLRKRVEAGAAGHFHFRHSMFLRLFEAVFNAWEARLQHDGCIDFDDMLNQATECLLRGTYRSPYDIVMVDEFQDASQARARLVSCLVDEPGRLLFAVGDDWQSINRFAGADLGVMTGFEKHFGKAVTLKLETTFRCPQSLCDLSSAFVSKNPEQLRKVVRATRGNVADPVSIVRVESEAGIRAAIERRIGEIAQSGKTRVLVLGRYRADEQYVPHRSTGADLAFMTVHTSKGLEADHVIIPRVTAETLGFPSGIEDDPVLQLAMPAGDRHPHAEERRLFYVALTRARESVTLVTIAHKESPFIAELVREHGLVPRDQDGSESRADLCPSCQEGFLVKRSGRWGAFYGCSRFPKCTNTVKIRREEIARGRSQSARR